MSNLPANEADFNLQQVLLIMNHLGAWLIRSGVGYTEFAAALKPVFYQQALNEIERIEKKETISAISLLSGLHRKDIAAFKTAEEQGKPLQETQEAESFSIPARVLGLWMTENWPLQMPFHHLKQPCFTALSEKISKEMHPKSVLNELSRLGIVKQEGKQVILLRNSFIPDQSTLDIRQVLSHNVQSHLAAGLHNIFLRQDASRLEESIRADELTLESAQILSEYSLQLWEDYSEKIMKLAAERCQSDKGKSDANQTFCLGIYQNDT